MKSIENGRSTSVWVDRWIMDGSPRRPINKEMFYDLLLKVSDLLDAQGG